MSDQQNNDQPPENGTNPIHEDFLNALPDDVDRDAAAQLVPHWDKYVQSKFEDAANFRKQFEPYQEFKLDDERTVKLNDIPPEELAELLAFREIAQDPESFQNWYNEIGQQMGGGEPQEVPGAAEEDYDDPLVARLAALEERLAQQDQQYRQWQEEQAFEESQHWVQGELDKIKEQYPSLTDQDLDDICALASRYEPSEDIVQKGFKDYQRIVGEVERDFFAKKSDQPSPAEMGGKPNTSVGPVTNYEDAAAAAKARVRAALSNR